MNVLFRVDPRLVHATMMNVWVQTTNAKLLILADAELAADPKRLAIQEMSAMGLVEVRAVAETELAAALERRPQDQVAVVIFSTIEAAERAVAAGVRMPKLNLGHVPEGEGRTELHPSVHLGPRDLEVAYRLETRGVDVFIQPLPRDKLIPLPRPRPAAPAPAPADRLTERLRVVNERGLHLRAAHVLAHRVSKLAAEVRIGSDGHFVNAKSLLGLTTLGAACGSLLEVEVNGANACEAMQTIRELFESGFDEGRVWVGDPAEGP